MLRGLGYPFSCPSSGQDGNFFEDEDAPDEGTRELDPIMCAGGIRLNALVGGLKKIGFCLLVTIIGIISSAEGFHNTLVRDFPYRPSHRESDGKYMEQFLLLEKWGILKRCKRDGIRFVSGYFTVPKGTRDRSIFNGKRLSQYCTTPPPVNLLDIARILQEIRKLSLKGGIHAVSGDWRHFFHQISCGAHCHPFFGVVCGGQYFMWQTLPMGWNYSPLIAQAVGWSLIAFREIGETPIVDDEALRGSNMPFFLPLLDNNGQDVGRIFLYYDNYLVIGTCAATCARADKRLRRNFTMFNVTVKEHALYGKRALEEDGLIYLGVHLHLIRRRERDATSGFIRWRLDPQRVASAVGTDWGSDGTYRDVASRVGKAIHQRLISLQPLYEDDCILQVINVLKRIGRAVPQCRLGWGGPADLGRDERDALRRVQTRYLMNDWIETRECDYSDPMQNPIVVSDASTSWGYGYFILERDMQVRVVRSQAWNDELKTLHIFLLELYAIIEAIERCPETCLTVITDNTAVAGVLRRGYSHNDTAMRWLRRIRGKRLEVITVPSKENESDILSRGGDTCLCAASITRVIDAFRRGEQRGVRPPYYEEGGEGMRHVEPCEAATEMDPARLSDK